MMDVYYYARTIDLEQLDAYIINTNNNDFEKAFD